MKKFLLILLVLLLVAAGAAWYKRDTVIGLLNMSRTRVEATAAEKDVLGTAAKNGKKILVAYFSWGGNTRGVARSIHEKIGGDIFEIRTEKPYPDDYKATVEVAKGEKAADARPAIVGPLPDTSGYDIVLLGFPIWWYVEPMAVDTFVTSVKLDGVTVLPFATSGTSTVKASEERLRKLLPAAKFGPGLLANIESSVEPWLKANGAM